jgi:deoxyribonuclease-4
MATEEPVPDEGQAGAAAPLIGSHATVTGGLASGALAYAAEVGAEVIQVFVSSPRGWAAAAADPAQDRRLRQAGLSVFVHATYLINLGAGNPEVAARSADALGNALRRGAEIGARGVVVHTGSATGWEAAGPAPAPAGETTAPPGETAEPPGETAAPQGDPGPGETASPGQEARRRALAQLGEIVLPLLDKLGDDDPDLLFEPMAGQGQMLCARAGDLPAYLAAVENHPRAGLCLDTCHLFAAGHDLAAAGGVTSVLAELAALDRGSSPADGSAPAGGLARVKLVHANDSQLGCGSRRDRHEAIGAGQIGTEPFRALLAALPGVPFVVETPGGKAGHARDIATLKGLCGR